MHPKLNIYIFWNLYIRLLFDIWYMTNPVILLYNLDLHVGGGGEHGETGGAPQVQLHGLHREVGRKHLSSENIYNKGSSLTLVKL